MSIRAHVNKAIHMYDSFNPPVSISSRDLDLLDEFIERMAFLTQTFL
jgi:hypothetical protein